MSLLKIYKSTYPINMMAQKNEIIYVFFNPITNLTKIGITTNLKERLSNLSNSSGVKLEVINYTQLCVDIDESARYVEFFLHNIFKQYRGVGEWFNFNNKQIKSISNFINLIPN